MPQHEEPKKGKRTIAPVSWLMLLVLVVVLAFYAVTNRHREDYLESLCSQYYAAARTAADTERVDRRIVELSGKNSRTCRGFRTILPP